MIVGYADNVLTARAFATGNGSTGSTPTRNCSPWARPTRRRVHPARLPGEQQWQPHGDRPPRQPQPVALARRPGIGGARRCCSCARLLESVPDRGPGRHRRLRRAAADRPRRVPPARAFRRSELLLALAARRRCWCSACCTACWSPSASPWPNCCAGWPARTTPSSASCRGPPACTTSTTTRGPAGARPGRLPVRRPLFFANAEDFRRRALAAVDDAPAAGRVVRAQRRGQRRGRPHRPGRGRGPARRADRAGSSSRARVKQDLLVARGQRGWPPGRHRTHLPDPPTAVQAYAAWYREQVRRAAHGVGDWRRPHCPCCSGHATVRRAAPHRGAGPGTGPRRDLPADRSPTSSRGT